MYLYNMKVFETPLATDHARTFFGHFFVELYSSGVRFDLISKQTLSASSNT